MCRWQVARKGTGVAVVVWMIPVVGVAASASAIGAQSQNGRIWNDAATRTLIARAIAYRSAVRAPSDSVPAPLTSYEARAHGFLTFLAQVGPGFPDPPRIVRSDELAVEVYWHAPDLSKEVLVGRRDTLLLPVDVGYYDDRFGIMQNDFRDSIRLGDGNDVRDVPHPLAPHAGELYDYAIVDSLRMRTPEASIVVVAVQVRPRDPAAPRAVGMLYLDRATGALVRVGLTFTHAAILDRRIASLSVTLENALVDGRYWLPHDQRLEVVRTTTWLNYPIRGIIRAHWTICCYAINSGRRIQFGGPEIVAVPSVSLGTYEWSGRILDSIPPDVRVPTPADVQRVEGTARELIRQSALAHAATSPLAIGGISDVARINRVEGLALGAGITHDVLSPDLAATLRGRFGISDRALKGEASLAWQQPDGLGLRVTAFRRYQDAGAFAESSLLANSLAAELTGSDHTDPYDARGVEGTVTIAAPGGLRWHATVTREAEGGLADHAAPALGHYGPTLPAWARWATQGAVGVDRAAAPGPFGTTIDAHAEFEARWFHRRDDALEERDPFVGRALGSVEVERPVGPDRLDVRMSAMSITAHGGLSGAAPQDFVFLGGPFSGPGYAYHSFVAATGATAHAEWRIPVPFPAINLGRRYGGATPAKALLAPFVHVVYVDQPAPFAVHREGWYPSVGVGTIALFDLLRIDVARGLRNGAWTFAIDADRGWWGIL